MSDERAPRIERRQRRLNVTRGHVMTPALATDGCVMPFSLGVLLTRLMCSRGDTFTSLVFAP